MDAKKCTRCGELKHPSLFSKLASSKDGLQRWCKSCSKVAKSAWSSSNSEHVSGYNSQYKAAHSDDVSSYNSKYYSLNRDAELARVELYQRRNRESVLAKKRLAKKNNPSAAAADNAARRALIATSSAVCAGFSDEIKVIYLYCAAWSVATKTAHHVDHIIPLRGKEVCGLHVPWNLQILPAKKNLKKGNRLDSAITML